MQRKMTALVIGNADYRDGAALANPVNDATDVSAKLKRYGFDVITLADATARDMDQGLKAFKLKLPECDIGLFFFAGHGIQIEGENYLVAVDSDVSDEVEAKHSSLALDRVISVMEKSRISTKVIVLDACRNNPWERRWHRAAGARGLASVYAPKGTIIAFATSPGQTASDGVGRNGTYTGALLTHIDAADCTIESMFKRVRNTVAAETGGKQITWEHTSLAGEFYFNMSLGKAIKDYAPTSLADSLFVIDETRLSHRIINGLKSYNWYTQNDALQGLTAGTAKTMLDDNLFVLGRNIYQAACGGSNKASAFIEKVLQATAGFPVRKRRALLDGMLFEIFVDSKGNHRRSIKGGMFNEVFELQQFGQLKESFDFIAESLVASGGDYFCVPGMGHGLVADVITKKKKDRFHVEDVFVNGTSVLRPESEDGAPAAQDRIFVSRSKVELETRLSEELMVPSRLLKVTYSPAAAKGETGFAYPLGYVARKH